MISFFVKFICLVFIVYSSNAEVTTSSSFGDDSLFESSTTCTSAQTLELEKQLQFCDKNWEEWGVLIKPPKEELLNPRQCTSTISLENAKRLAYGCGEALMAIPALLGETAIRGMMALTPEDKMSFEYIANHGSLQDMQVYYTQEFFREKCKLAAEDDSRFLDQSCKLPSSSVNCNAFIDKVRLAKQCRNSTLVRRAYREKEKEILSQAAKLFSQQKESIKNNLQKKETITFLKEKCNPAMNPYSSSYASMLLNPVAYLAKSGQNLVWPSDSDIQKYNKCIHDHVKDDLELQKKLQKKSAGLVESITDSMESLKCYSSEIQLKVKCDIAIVLLTGGAGLGRMALDRISHKVGQKSLEGALTKPIATLGVKNASSLQADVFKATTKLFHRSGRVEFFNMGGPIKEIIEPGASYTVLVRDGQLILGKNILGMNGLYGGTKSHYFLRQISHVDVDDIGADGALRFNADGSIDISGYHNGQLSLSAAQDIKELVFKIAPQARVRATGNRLSTLESP